MPCTPQERNSPANAAPCRNMQRAPFERLKKRRSNMLPVLLSQNGGTSCIVQYSAVPERLLKERIGLALFFYKIEVYFAEKRRLITIRLFSVLHSHRLHTCKSFANMTEQMYTEIYKECQVKMSDSQDSSPIPPKSLFYKKCAKIEKKVLKYLSSYSII